jgi:hypothetical protein
MRERGEISPEADETYKTMYSRCTLGDNIYDITGSCGCGPMILQGRVVVIHRYPSTNHLTFIIPQPLIIRSKWRTLYIRYRPMNISSYSTGVRSLIKHVIP